MGRDHYGWAVWGGIYLLSVIAGVLAERFFKRDMGCVRREKVPLVAGSFLQEEPHIVRIEREGKTMAYQKRRFVLRGRRGVLGNLTLEERERLFYFLECPQPAAGDIVLFYGPHSWRKLTGNCGHQLCMQSRLGRDSGGGAAAGGKGRAAGFGGAVWLGGGPLAYEKAQKPADPGERDPRPGWTRMWGSAPEEEGGMWNRRPRHPGSRNSGSRKHQEAGRSGGKTAGGSGGPFGRGEAGAVLLLDSLPQMEMASPRPNRRGHRKNLSGKRKKLPSETHPFRAALFLSV